MSRVIKDGGIIEDQTRIIEPDVEEHSSTDHEGRCFLPFKRWLDSYPNFDDFAVQPGIWIEGSESVEALEAVVADIPAIAIRFSQFSDGTGFSTGALLRESYGFDGELRAYGDLIADQALQLRRCGFNVIALKEGECLETALSMLLTTGLSYQGTVHSPRTPFKFRF